MKKVLNGLKRIAMDTRLHSCLIGTLLAWGGMGGGTCMFLFGELPFPQESYDKLKMQISES